MLVVIAAVAGWMLRDRIPWGREDARVVPATEASIVWERLTPEGARRARETVGRLAGRSGPVFTNVSPGDLAAYIFEELSQQLPPSAEDTEAAVIGDRLHVRATMRMSELGGGGVLGPMAGMVRERERVEFGGILEVVRPRLAQFRVQQLRVGDLTLPPPMIPRLVPRVSRGARPEGIADDALALVIPVHVGDVRVSRGRITLYKATP